MNPPPPAIAEVLESIKRKDIVELLSVRKPTTLGKTIFQLIGILLMDKDLTYEGFMERHKGSLLRDLRRCPLPDNERQELVLAVLENSEEEITQERCKKVSMAVEGFYRWVIAMLKEVGVRPPSEIDHR